MLLAQPLAPLGDGAFEWGLVSSVMLDIEEQTGSTVYTIAMTLLKFYTRQASRKYHVYYNNGSA